MSKKQPTYEEAVKRIEEIVTDFENNSLPLNEIGSRLKEAKALLKECKSQLLKTEEEVNQLLEDVEE